MDFGHPLADKDLLWTELLAIFAIETVTGVFFRREPIIVGGLGMIEFVIHRSLVVYFEVARDVDAAGAGQAVFTFCAWDWGKLVVFLSDLRNQLQLVH